MPGAKEGNLSLPSLKELISHSFPLRVLSFPLVSPINEGFPGGSGVKNLPGMQETPVDCWVRKIPGGGNGNHSSILARFLGFPPTDRGAWWSMGSQRVGHNLATKQQQYAL